MKKTRWIILLLSAGMLAACSTTKHIAPVSERTVTDVTTTGEPAEDRSYYVVKKGDTLYRIALDFGQSYRELVTWNHLDNPNAINVGQILRVSPPTGAAKSTAQTAAIATTSSGIETRELAPPTPPNKTEPNGSKQPYSDSKLAEMKKHDELGSNQQGDDGEVSWMWPTAGKVTTGFDDNKKGIDIDGKSGQPVVAAGSGKVMYAGSGIRGYGNLVIVKHTSTLLSAYAHNKKILVKEGQTVVKGQKIAEMGDSDSDAVKLHFEIRQQGKPVDPTKFLPNR